jgi:hypothetical protein
MMIQKLMILFLSLALLIGLNSCYTGGSFISQNVTNVELSNPNFKIVEKDLEGSASADYLFGMSYSTGFLLNTFAIARIGGPAKLYDTAIQNLWDKYEEKHGNRQEKKLALINVHYDSDILNLIIYTKTKLFITADVIEFEE